MGDYLLKPINKAELTQTVQKMHRKITEQAQTNSQLHQLMANDQTARNARKHNLHISLRDENFHCTLESLREDCDDSFRAGIFQSFCLKIDYDSDNISTLAVKTVFQKAQDIFNGNLKAQCYTLICSVQEDYLYGILNFAPNKLDDVHRVLRDCLNQLVMQKNMFGPITITIACGPSSKNASDLPDSMRSSVNIMQSRIVLGTERILDTLPQHTHLQDVNLIEQYSRQIGHACDVFSQEEANNIVNGLYDAIRRTKNVYGKDVYHLVQSAGSVFLMQRNLPEQEAKVQEFVKKCNRCCTMDSLFAVLRNLQASVIADLQKAHDLESIRPIRLAKQYIQNHYMEQITLEQVSEVVGLSASYFSAVFKKEIGEGFAKYLINVRMEQAKLLLRDSNQSVSGICKQVGYHDVKHFNQTFEKSTGLKPSAYRKLYG